MRVFYNKSFKFILLILVSVLIVDITFNVFDKDVKKYVVYFGFFTTLIYIINRRKLVDKPH